MTYCVGMLLDTGLVFLSDSRTSAGVDQISTFRKTTVFQKPGERVLVLQSCRQPRDHAGRDQHAARDACKAAATAPNLMNVRSLFDAARCVGEALREVHRDDAEALRSFAVEFNASLMLGGQIAGRGAAPVQHLLGRQFHRGHRRDHLFPDRRVEVRQADHRSRDPPQQQPERGRQVRADLNGFDHPLESVGGPAAGPGHVKRDQQRVARHVSIDDDNAYFAGHPRNAGARRCATRSLQLPEPDWLKAGG